MSATQNDNLVDLIESLSMSEKRYFRLQAGLYKGAKKYLLLFDIICRDSRCGDKEIKRRLSKNISVGNIARLKHYLYTRILEELANFHRHSAPKARLFDLIHQCQLLIERGLQSQCELLLAKARKEAEAQDDYAALLEIAALKRQLINHWRDINDESELQKIDAYEISLLNDYKKTFEYDQLKDQYFLRLRQTRATRDYEAFAQWRAKFFRQPLLEREGNAMFPYALRQFHYLNTSNAFHEKNIEYVYRHATAHMQILKREKHVKSDSQIELARIWHLVIDTQIFCYFFSHAQRSLQQLQSMGTLPKSYREYHEYFLVSRTLLLLTRSGEFAKARAYAESIESLTPASIRMTTGIEFTLSHIIVLYLVNEEYGFTEQWCVAILNDERFHPVLWLQQLARLALLFVNYETGDFDLVEYRLNAARRYFYKSNPPNVYTDVISKFLRSAITTGDDQQQQRALLLHLERQLSDSLRQNSLIPGETGFDVWLYWTRGKLEQRPIVEIAREEAIRYEEIMTKRFAHIRPPEL